MTFDKFWMLNPRLKSRFVYYLDTHNLKICRHKCLICCLVEEDEQEWEDQITGAEANREVEVEEEWE
jgi:hypothetical protein